MKTLKALFILRLFDVINWLIVNSLVICLSILGGLYTILMIMWLYLQYHGNIR